MEDLRGAAVMKGSGDAENFPTTAMRDSIPMHAYALWSPSLFHSQASAQFGF
jgi:glutamine synthetase type III